jgi:competence protein ComEA
MARRYPKAPRRSCTFDPLPAHACVTFVVTIDDMTALFHSRGRAVAIVVLAVLVLLLLGRSLARSGAPSAAPSRAPVRIPVAAPPPTVVVDVVGAVRQPGLYRLRRGDRVADAVTRAGGATPKADLEQVNLAAPVADGEQVVVPRRGAAPPAGVAAAPGTLAGPVHLNTATPEQLDALPGIGPVTAQKIVDYRTQHGAFHSVDELDAISGIGPARIEQLRGLVAP